MSDHTCGVCAETLPAEAFYPAPALPNGLASCCKRCTFLYQAYRMSNGHLKAIRAHKRRVERRGFTSEIS